MVSLQHSLAIDTSKDQLDGMADGLVDIVVSAHHGSGSAYPPETDVDRYIAATVIEMGDEP
jgi:hypothetical protein